MPRAINVQNIEVQIVDWENPAVNIWYETTNNVTADWITGLRFPTPTPNNTLDYVEIEQKNEVSKETKHGQLILEGV